MVESPNVGTNQYNVLLGVTCVSPTDCWAVGDYNDGIAQQTLTERWNGNAWSIVSSPNKNPAATEQTHYLLDVTCVSASNCWTVGSYNNGVVQQTLTEHWDGTSWSIVDSPNTSPALTNFLRGVSCLSASNCWAVGNHDTGVGGLVIDQTLIERWDGVSWTIVDSPNTDATQNNVLSSISCTSASDCWAAGSHAPDAVGLTLQTLIEHWNGTEWSIVSSPNASSTQTNDLNQIACTSLSNCWAVGVASSGLTEHWKGSSWDIVPSPDIPDYSSDLLGVSCAGDSDCWAVGIYSLGPIAQTFTLHWNGTDWSIVESQNTSDMQSNFLVAVKCTSASDCWAVGYWNNGSTYQTLIEHYTVPVPLNAVVSRKVHGSAGIFDVDLTNGRIECRSGGANGDYMLVFSFANPLTSIGGVTVTAGSATVASKNVDPNDAYNYIVNLTGVTNAQRITVSLTNVSDSTGAFSASIPIMFGVLVGDTNADGAVNSADISQVKSQSGQTLRTVNFREELNGDGAIDSTDISLVKSMSGTALPSAGVTRPSAASQGTASSSTRSTGK